MTKFFERHPGAIIPAWFLAIALLIGACYGGKVLISPVKGAGDVYIEQHDKDVIINAQAELQKRYATLAPMCDAITSYHAMYMGDKSQFNLVNYNGSITGYRSAVAEYNAKTAQLLYVNQVGDLPTYVNADKCPGLALEIK